MSRHKLRGSGYGPFNERKKPFYSGVPPGYNYFGPGNEIDDYPPLNPADKAALKHDKAYTSTKDYFITSKADEDFIKELEPTNALEYGAKKFFETKHTMTNFLKGSRQFGSHDDKGKKKATAKPKLKKKWKFAEAYEKYKKGRSPHEITVFGDGSTKKTPVKALPAPSDISPEKAALSSSQRKDIMRRRIEPIEDEGANPNPDMEIMALAGGSGGGPGRGLGEETLPDPWGNAKLRPFPPTQNVILPFKHISANIVLAAGANAYNQFSFRLNSISDILKDNNAVYVPDPTPAPDSLDVLGSRQQSALFDYWKYFYRYWTVLESHYTVTFWPVVQAPATTWDTRPCQIFCYHHGLQFPPATDGAGNIISELYRKMHTNMHYKELALAHSLNERDCTRNKTIFTGKYTPSSIDHGVAEDEYDEIWTFGTATPVQTECATFIVQRDDISPFDISQNWRYQIEIVYHVQFKDLKADYEYIGPTADISLSDFAKQGTV